MESYIQGVSLEKKFVFLSWHMFKVIRNSWNCTFLIIQFLNYFFFVFITVTNYTRYFKCISTHHSFRVVSRNSSIIRIRAFNLHAEKNNSFAKVAKSFLIKLPESFLCLWALKINFEQKIKWKRDWRRCTCTVEDKTLEV